MFEAIQTTERDVDFNTVQITGKIFKEPIFRLTPKGRKIVDVLLMIQRTQGKSDYIPCIFWGDEAEFVANEFKVGDNITIDGRLQSRKYSKIEDGKMLIKVAYEVSGKLLCQ
ncbi:MAG: single-stranded DNA-binding protein [bacterium]|nr:single-stranded DNA-binding protein [bacterium]